MESKEDGNNTATDLICIWGFRGYPDLADLSPFVLKVVAYCELQGLAYNLRGVVNFRRDAPRGMVPFADIDGKRISDSDNIIEELEEALPVEKRLDHWLTPEQHAIALAFKRLLDHSLFYSAFVYTRFIPDEGWNVTKRLYFAESSAFFRAFLNVVLRRKCRARLISQGSLRRPLEEMVRMAIGELEAISDLVGSKPFALGTRPCSLDASIFGFLHNMRVDAKLGYDFDPVRKHLLQHQRLNEYIDTVSKAFHGQQNMLVAEQ